MSKTITKSTNLNIRLDQESRRRLQKLADELGVPASTLAAANIKQMIRDGGLRLSTSLEPTDELKAIMKEVDSDIAVGRNISPAFDNVEDMFESLESGD